MDFSRKDIFRMIIQEVQKIQNEDLSKLNFLTPAAALRFMRAELNNKNLIFFDLETMGFTGQITQVAAFSYKIENLDGPPPENPSNEFLAKIQLDEETISRQQWERRNPGGVAQRKAKWPQYATVDEMLRYTHYDDFLPDFEPLGEKRVISDFFNWVDGVENGILVGHNIKSFDLNRLLKRAKKFGIPFGNFQKSDIFDTRAFTTTVFKNAMLIASNYEDSVAKELIEYTEEQKVKFNAKLDKLMKIFNDSSKDQLHTADDDTKQLVDVFFAMYRKILQIEKDHGEDSFADSSYRNVRKMRAELYSHMKKMGMFVNKDIERDLKRRAQSMPHEALEELIMRIRSEPEYIPEI